jgi:mono/diheme cytochrome c family protein
MVEQPRISNGVHGLKAVGAVALSLWLSACTVLDEAPGRPRVAQEEGDPRTVVSFNALYATNCAGCHGARGEGGAAMGLAAPNYLATAPDEAITQVVAEGRPGTAMPAFAE